MTRAEILAQINQAHANLVAAFAGIPDDVMTTQPVVDWWTLKDVLGHVAMWQQVAIKFINEFQRGGVPTPLGFADDAALDAYNKRGAALRRDWSLARARAEFDASFRDLVAAIEPLSDANLNQQLSAPWSEGRNLAYLIAVNSYEHAPEHTEQIVKWHGEHATPH
jgi:hypothetical protein